MSTYFDELLEVGEVFFAVDCQLAVFADHPVMLHLTLIANTKGVISGVTGTFTHQVQPVVTRMKQLLRLLPRNLPIQPSNDTSK